MPRFRTIVADPPWPYPEGFATQSRTPGRWAGPILCKPLPYLSMSLDALRGLPLPELAADDCRLFLWATNRYLPDAMLLADLWGFRYRQTLVWHKRDGNMGGSVAANSAEFLIVAIKGAPRRLARMSSAVISTAAPKRHSTKPEVIQDFIEQVSPGPYLEMFARRPRAGWSVWGNEVESDIDLVAA